MAGICRTYTSVSHISVSHKTKPGTYNKIKNMKQFFIILGFLSLIFFVCTHVTLVTQGTTEGLSIWYNHLVPVVLPFLLISGYFLASLNLEHLSKARAVFLILVSGLFCGYPIGAIVISRLYLAGSISSYTAYALMPLCNNVSPMFLTGYIYQQYLQEHMPLYSMLGLIYVPQAIYACICLFLCHMGSRKPAAGRPDETKGSDVHTSVMENSISSITMIGLYIVIFTIISRIILFYNKQDLFSVKIISAFLEITKGIPDLFQLDIGIKIKTALILSLTSFGGISSIFQSVHIFKESKLSLYPYIIGKTICSAATCIIIYVLA